MITTSQRSQPLTSVTRMQPGAKVFGSSDYDVWARKTKAPALQTDDNQLGHTEETYRRNTQSQDYENSLRVLAECKPQSRYKEPKTTLPTLSSTENFKPTDKRKLHQQHRELRDKSSDAIEKRRVRLCAKNISTNAECRRESKEVENESRVPRLVKTQLLTANFDSATVNDADDSDLSPKRTTAPPVGRRTSLKSPLTLPALPAPQQTRFPMLSGSVRRLPAPAQLQQMRSASEPLRHASLASRLYTPANLSLPVPLIEPTNFQFATAQSKSKPGRRTGRSENSSKHMQFFHLIKERCETSSKPGFPDVYHDHASHRRTCHHQTNNERLRFPTQNDQLRSHSSSTVTTLPTDSLNKRPDCRHENLGSVQGDRQKSVRYKVAAPMLSRSQIIGVLDDLDAVPM